MTAVAEKEHAVLGPSGWHTWGNCPGSVPLSDGIVKQTSSYAKEGTAAHALLEQCLSENADAETKIGEEYEVEGEVFVVDQEMADAVNSTIDIVRSYLDEGAILQVEQTVPLAFMTGEQGAEGTCDVAVIREGGTHLVIADFKYGKGVMVYASEPIPETTQMRPNGQLAMYALGWLQKYGIVYEEVTKVTLAVIQPRLEWHDEYTLPIEQLREFENVVREAAGAVELERLSDTSELTLVPGEKQCKFCDAKAICPALKNHVSTSLAVIAEPSKVEDFADLTLPKQAAAVAVRPDISNEKLAEFMRAVSLIEEAIGAARAEVERRLFAGQDIPGFYLGVGRKGRRQWRDEDQALKELTKSGRLKMAEAQARKPISPTEAEKLLKDRPQIWAKIAPQIHQPEGKPSVCREGDKNPRYQIVASEEDFADLDAAPKIVTAKTCVGGDGLFIEANDGTHVVVPSKQCKGPLMKLARVGEPIQPLLDAMKPLRDTLAESVALEDLLG